jgi:NAD(P)-dependent dehydrogenase (short-subunit alcohol dehydrogenase family)
MKQISDMSILVTGGGSGIGKAIAKYFCNNGAKVTISGRRKKNLKLVSETLGDNCNYIQGDVTNDIDRKKMIDGALNFGGKLDALINNAANMYRQPVDSYVESFLKEAFDTNVISAMMLSSESIKHLEKTEGSIIFIGSTHTRRAFPGASPYATTKAALEGLTKVMAAELGPKKIRVGCVLPGAVITELNIRAGIFEEKEIDERYKAVAKLHALGRIGTTEEVAESVAHLVQSEWITGVALEVDGGIGLGVSSF